MRVAPFDKDAFKMDHPRGTVSFNYLLMGGEPEKLENFRYILGRQEADFKMPRHRHSFEQIRLAVAGDMNLGEQGMLREGEIGYFPEGLHYGPQDDLMETYDGNRLQLVLQFGGASGLGMGASRGRGPQARREEPELARRPRREIKLPRPRYTNVIKIDPKHFNWLPVPGIPGVERKYLGAFTERGFWIEYVKVAPGTEWVSTTDAAGASSSPSRARPPWATRRSARCRRSRSSRARILWSRRPRRPCCTSSACRRWTSRPYLRRTSTSRSATAPSSSRGSRGRATETAPGHRHLAPFVLPGAGLVPAPGAAFLSEPYLGPFE